MKFYIGIITFLALSASQLGAFTIDHSNKSSLPTVKIRVFETPQDFAKMLKARNFSQNTIDFIIGLGEQVGEILTKVADYEENKEKKKEQKSQQELEKELDSIIGKMQSEESLSKKGTEKKPAEKTQAQKIAAAGKAFPIASEAVKGLKNESIFDKIVKTITRKAYTVQHYLDVKRGTSVTWPTTSIAKEVKDKKSPTLYVVIIERGSNIPLWEGYIDKDGSYTFTAETSSDGSINGTLKSNTKK